MNRSLPDLYSLNQKLARSRSGFMAKVIRVSLFLISLTILALGCKKEDTSFDLLLTGDASNSTGDQLEILHALPDVGSLVLEVGDNEDFSVAAQAPNNRAIAYGWTWDGAPVVGTTTYSLTAGVGEIGSHTLKVVASDGFTTEEKQWSIKVNGPPVAAKTTTGTPATAVGSAISIVGSATDPNSDILIYTWLLNGVSSPYLVGTSATATFTGDTSLVGANTITLKVSDGTAESSVVWDAEVNHFPQACNTLSQGQICTYAGGPHKGNGLAVNNTDYPLRFRPYGHTQDALGNVFVSDYENGVIWYWNKTGAPVTRIGRTIAANTIEVVAGTGSDQTGGTGIPAINSPLNNPRGIAYDDASGILYVAEYGGSLVKYIDSTGTVFTGMGGGGSHVDGDTAFNHNCDLPTKIMLYSNSLYVACYNHHRVKRWDLATGLGYVMAGDGGNDNNGEGVAATSGGIGQPMALYVDANGIYIGSWRNDRVRFVNTTGAPITFWSGNPDQVTINPGNIATIIGDGGTGQTPTVGNPTSIDMSNPAGITVVNGNEIFVTSQGRDNILFANNSGAPVTIDGLTYNPGEVGRINFNGGGYNGDGPINGVRVNDVYDISVDVLDGSKLLFSDYTNFRFRQLDLTTDETSQLAGSGRGKNGFYGDVSLPSMEHLFNYPNGLAFEDSSRTLFFVDQNNYRIRQVSPYGLISTAVGRGGGDPSIENDIPTNVLLRTNINGNLTPFTGIDIWSDGTLAQLNSYGHNLRLWNRSGSDQNYVGTFVQSNRIATVAGDWSSGLGNGPDGPALNTQLRYPNSARFYDNAGNMEVWIVDTMNHCIRKVDNSGNITAMLGTCGTSGNPGINVPEAAALFNRPEDIAFDEKGNLFISDFANHTIWYWNRGVVSETVGTITINANQIARIACLSGTGGSSAEGVFATTSRCNQPVGLAYHAGQLCYSQRSRHNVRCINTSTGLVTTVAGAVEAAPTPGSLFDFGQEGVVGTSARLFYPSGVTFDGSGDLYISDTYNHIVRKVKLSP